MISRFEHFISSISEIGYGWHKIAQDVLSEYGIKGAYASYLTTLNRYPEGISSARLGELCHRDKADVSRAVSELEKKGFIRREGGSAGVYRAKLVLTQSGRDASDAVVRKALKAVELGGRGLTEAERAAFQHALDLIAENLTKLSREGLPKE